MAIPTWKNVSTGSNYGANSLLTSAGNQIQSGLKGLSESLGTYEQGVQEANVNTIADNLSSSIGNFGGDPQQYQDYITQQVRGDDSLTSTQKQTLIDNALAERNALAQLTPAQQTAVEQQKVADAQGLEDLQFQQQGAERNLQAEVNYPLERFGWKGDDSLSVKDVKAKYAHLEDSGMNVDAIHDSIANQLGYAPSGKELEGLILDATQGDFSPLNSNSVEVVDNFLSKLRGTSLTDRVKEYQSNVGNVDNAQKVRDLQREHANQRNAYTAGSTKRIKDFTAGAATENINVSRGATRQPVNFLNF